jgi:hypothetical protein
MPRHDGNAKRESKAQRRRRNVKHGELARRVAVGKKKR